MTFSRWAAIVAALICASSVARAEHRTLTLEQALSMAREHAPAIASARARVDEAQGRLRDASVLFRNNPSLEAEAGPRVTPGEAETTDLRFGISQSFGLGGGRGARIASATADRARTLAESEMETVRVVRDVTVAFYHALYAEEQVRLTSEAESLAVHVVRITERRYETGEIARLELNVARTARSRARAERLSASTMRNTATGSLSRVLGMSAGDSVAVQGDLAHGQRDFELADLLARALARPDLRALAAEIAQADAEARLAGSQRWPEMALGVAWEREENSEIGLGLVELTLPIFNRGQGLRDESRSRSRRLHGEYEALKRAVLVDIQTTFSAYRDAVAAADELEENAVPLLNENEALLYRAYEAGKIGLTELLLLRREAIATRVEYLARLLEAAVVGAELKANTGLLE